jgi:hypothetical protein
MFEEDKLRPVFATGIDAASPAKQAKAVIAYILRGDKIYASEIQTRGIMRVDLENAII